MDDIGQFIVNFIEDDDMESFEIIYKYYHDRIFNFIRSYAAFRGVILSKDDAEEILDDVFVQIWRVRKKFKIERPIDYNKVEEDFEDWLFFIARKYKVNDFIEIMIRQIKTISSGDISDLLPDENISSCVPDRDQIERVLELLAPLKDYIKKAILFLYHNLDFSDRILAEILNDIKLDEDESAREAALLRQNDKRARKELQDRMYTKDNVRQKVKRARVSTRYSFVSSSRYIPSLYLDHHCYRGGC